MRKLIVIMFLYNSDDVILLQVEACSQESCYIN